MGNPVENLLQISTTGERRSPVPRTSFTSPPNVVHQIPRTSFTRSPERRSPNSEFDSELDSRTLFKKGRFPEPQGHSGVRFAQMASLFFRRTNPNPNPAPRRKNASHGPSHVQNFQQLQEASRVTTTLDDLANLRHLDALIQVLIHISQSAKARHENPDAAAISEALDNFAVALDIPRDAAAELLANWLRRQQ